MDPERHPVAERARLLREGEEAWGRLRAILDGAPEAAALHAPGSPVWSARDVYAHFARYQGHGISQLRRVLAGADPLPPDGDDDDTRNERWAAADRALSLDQARDWCLATTRELRDLLMSLRPEEWERWGAGYGDDVLAPHYEAHIRYIESVRADG